jgi:hypothetical protein
LKVSLEEVNKCEEESKKYLVEDAVNYQKGKNKFKALNSKVRNKNYFLQQSEQWDQIYHKPNGLRQS